MDMTMWENYIIGLRVCYGWDLFTLWREKWLKTVIGFHDYSKEKCSEQKMS